MSAVAGPPAVQTSGPGRRADGALVLATVLALVVAEAVVAFVGPVPGAALHGVLLLALLVRWVAAGDRALLALAFVPLARVTSLALTVDDTGAGAYALAGLPLLLAVGWAAGDLRRPSSEPRRRPGLLAAGIAVGGLLLGGLVHLLLDLPPADGVPLVVAALVVFVVAGVLEELLYRGLVQRALTERFGTAGVLLAALLSTAAALPTRDPELVAVTAGVALAAGLYVRRTGDLATVAVAHGLLAVGALVLWPAWT